MKNILLISIAASISLVSCGQDMPAEKVPSVVQNTVQSAFGAVLNIEWEKKKQYYEAEFDRDSIEYTACIDATGKLLMYKADIALTTLPAAIATTIGVDHAGYTIDDTEKLEKDGLVYYQVELEAKGKKDRKLVFTADGKTTQQVQYLN
jgi:uncharacterized membrane protein YkoI